LLDWIFSLDPVAIFLTAIFSFTYGLKKGIEAEQERAREKRRQYRKKAKKKEAADSEKASNNRRGNDNCGR
jgi:hypothetical protein